MTTPDEVDEEAVLMEELARHGLHLARAARARDRDRIAELLADIPGGRPDLLALACAALIDTRQPLGELLAWSLTPPAGRPPRRYQPTGRPPGRPRHPREHGTPRGYQQHKADRTPYCEDCTAAHAVAQRPAICQEEFARLRAAGVAPTTAAQLSTLARVLARRTGQEAHVA